MTTNEYKNRECLARFGIKATKQRMAILSKLMQVSCGEWIPPQTLHELILADERLPNLSLATVYNTLNAFEAAHLSDRSVSYKILDEISS